NQKDFPSFVHRSLWSNGLLLMPPEISLENIDGDKKATCLDLYRYKADMYSDMYQNPSLYCIDVEGIQQAMQGKTWHQAHMSARWNKQKDRLNKLDEIEQTNLPDMVCQRLVTYMICEENQYYLDKANYDKYFLKQTFNKCGYKLNESEFLSMLSRCGLILTKTDNRVYFTNHKYQLMLQAIEAWQQLLAPYRKGSKKYTYDSAFSHLDYRFFSPGHKLTFENSKWYMDDEVIAFLSDINNIISRQGKGFTKLDNTTRIAIGFRIKGSGHVEFEHARTYPVLRLKLFHSDSAEYRAFEERISQLPNADEVRDYCIKWIRRCNRCPCHPVPSASMIGRPRVIFGRKMKLCGPYLNLQTADFSEKSLAIIKTIIELEQAT
ncbi:MAG: hypothetical protein FWD16_05830, partial [Clostridia bacterium]|nr:hypothetical protein [Clostridia bacterium]